LEELGLHVYVDVPDSTQAQLQRSSELIARTASRRSTRTGGDAPPDEPKA
jgi:hypothetical protein